MMILQRLLCQIIGNKEAYKITAVTGNQKRAYTNLQAIKKILQEDPKNEKLFYIV
jgi:hypothetical protein